MFEYFDNYVWNLSTNIALNTGGHIGEIEEMCAPLKEYGAGNEDGGTEAFFKSWTEKAYTLRELADEDEANGRYFSASEKHNRASVYLLTAERMQSHHYEPRKQAYADALESFSKYAKLGKRNCELVEVPYEGSSFPGIFVTAEGLKGGEKAPCMILGNGLDSFKEMIYGSGIQDQLAKRGISSIAIDHPGSGAALRLRNMPATPEAERWGSATVDYLETRTDIDLSRIGNCSWSLGGYYAPRVAAYEPRIKLCVAWGSNYNWAEVQHKRLDREGENPVPHYWDHVQWVFGTDNMKDFMEKAERMTLKGHLQERIKIPFLITHGSNDRQISVEYAHQMFEEITNSPKRELKIFTKREGGVEHCSCDNMSYARDYIADWIAETFGTHTA